MRFKVIYVEDGKVKRCFMHIPGYSRVSHGSDDVLSDIEGRFRRNPWWGMRSLEVWSERLQEVWT